MSRPEILPSHRIWPERIRLEDVDRSTDMSLIQRSMSVDEAMLELTARCCGPGGRDEMLFRFMRETCGWLNGIEGEERDRIEQSMLSVAKRLGLLAVSPSPAGTVHRTVRVTKRRLAGTKRAEYAKTTTNESPEHEYARPDPATSGTAFNRPPRHSAH